MDSSTAVINPRFCLPGEVHLTIVKNTMPIIGGDFMVTNDHGDVMFNVKERMLSFHSRHVLLDAAGNPIATLKKKVQFVLGKVFPVIHEFFCLALTLALSFKGLSALGRWQVFKGDSSDPGDVLFSATQFRTGELDVILGNKENNSWDFKVVGSWLERSCIIYNHHSTAIAQVQRKHKFRSVVKGRDTLSLIVSPDVDYSFVVALVVILDRINHAMDD